MIARFEFRAMAGVNELLIDSDDQQHAAAAQLAIAEVHRIEAKYSRYRPDSVVSRINASAAKEAIAIDEETAMLLNYADTLHQQSDGLFDITSGVLRTVWSFDKPSPPSQAQIDDVLPLIGWGKVERRFEQNAISIRLPKAGMQLDFGGFGKEYAADRAAMVLRAHGVQRALVNLAGDVMCFDLSDVPSPWSVGIQHPRRAQGEAITSVSMVNAAMATSGDYERFVDVNSELSSKRYCHLLNPLHGWPTGFDHSGTQWSEPPFASVSITAPNALVAGSLSTVAMLKPASEALAWLRAMGAAFWAIDRDGKLHR
jgi:FAD:protein FMN transferase